MKLLTPTSIAKLKTFSTPENFHLNLLSDSIVKQIKKSDKQSYNLILAGRFTYNLFEQGKSVAIEETPVDHRELAELCKNTDNKILITYDFDHKIPKAFKNNRIIMIDKYGTQTEREDRAEEIIVANF